jgi:hypothetical protein
MAGHRVGSKASPDAREIAHIETRDGPRAGLKTRGLSGDHKIPGGRGTIVLMCEWVAAQRRTNRRVLFGLDIRSCRLAVLSSGGGSAPIDGASQDHRHARTSY